MADVISPEARSRLMGRIRSKDTAPELCIRRFLHGKGLRYRVHCRDLPGNPDVVFSRGKLCIFIHGCFWHGCERCIDGLRRVKSNEEYWSSKIATNRVRDQKHREALEMTGWAVLTVWECELNNRLFLDSFYRRIVRVLRVARGDRIRMPQPKWTKRGPDRTVDTRSTVPAQARVPRREGKSGGGTSAHRHLRGATAAKHLPLG